MRKRTARWYSRDREAMEPWRDLHRLAMELPRLEKKRLAIPHRSEPPATWYEFISTTHLVVDAGAGTSFEFSRSSLRHLITDGEED